MAIIKRADGMFLIRQEPLQWGTAKQARSFFAIGLQSALDLSAQLRAAGIEAYASSDSGNIQDPSFVPQKETTDLTVRWPSTWQTEIEELGPNRFCIRFVDEFRVSRAVIGRTPQEAVDKLQMQSLVDPAVRNYLQSITPQEPEAVVPVAAPVSTTPRKFLRPGDRAITEQDLAEMEARRAESQKPKTPPQEVEYSQYWNSNSISIAAKKERSRNDPGFLAWLNKNDTEQRSA
jgi:hypothetical protein